MAEGGGFMSEKKVSGGVGLFGATSLFVTFSVLCLAVFSIISLQTARSEDEMSRRSAEMTAIRYAAGLEANEVLSELRRGEIRDGVVYEDGVWSYSCPVTDTQVLSVGVRCGVGGEYELVYWKYEPCAEWEISDDIDLWDGE